MRFTLETLNVVGLTTPLEDLKETTPAQLLQPAVKGPSRVRAFVAIRSTHAANGPSPVDRREFPAFDPVFRADALRVGLRQGTRQFVVLIFVVFSRKSVSRSMQDDSSSYENGDI
jgi:hypothetical protein